jgi:hypothetical protein
MGSQTWCINGRHFTREQLDLYRAELAGGDPKLSMEDDEKPEVEVKVVKRASKSSKVAKKEEELSVEVQDKKEDERVQLEREFNELKAKKAWNIPSLRTRYDAIKKVLKK